jgi:hypothetical protein
MLVIGFCGNLKGGDVITSASFDVDIKSDTPRKVHDVLSEMKGMAFEHITLVENDTVVATYSDGEDYDLAEFIENEDEGYTDMFENDLREDDMEFGDVEEDEFDEVE